MPRKPQALVTRFSFMERLTKAASTLRSKREVAEAELEELKEAEAVVGEVLSEFDALLDQLEQTMNQVQGTLTELQTFVRERREELKDAVKSS